MAKCQQCGKGPQFGNNRPWSNKATRRRWNVNIQKIKVMDDTGKQVSKRLCTSCIKSLYRTA
jgi:large subunit ribosomal protein L28